MASPAILIPVHAWMTCTCDHRVICMPPTSHPDMYRNQMAAKAIVTCMPQQQFGKHLSVRLRTM